MKKTVIVIVGPTAVGKTKLSIEIAKRFNGKVISGDSMQVYKGMDIGTAKVTEEEMQGIEHAMIDIKDPSEAFTVVDYQEQVQKHIEDITSNQQLPIITGGSGLYIQATLYNYHFTENKRDEKITKELEKVLETEGINPLYERLKEIDPIQAKKIHRNNHRRVIRALEVYERTGKPISEYHDEQPKESPYNPIFIGLEMDREVLYNRINSRVDIMMESGLLAEVEDLYNKGLRDAQAMQAIGYKEFIPFIEGCQTLEETIELLKRNSRRYAKRQYTWFKNKMDINWYELNPESLEEDFKNIFIDLAGILRN